MNCHNLFDAAAGFGGYKESGFGREAGREGLFEYTKLKWMPQVRNTFTQEQIDAPWGADVPPGPGGPGSMAADKDRQVIDRTLKLFIGGKQARPDGNYSRVIYGPNKVRHQQIYGGRQQSARNNYGEESEQRDCVERVRVRVETLVAETERHRTRLWGRD